MFQVVPSMFHVSNINKNVKEGHSCSKNDIKEYAG